MKTLTRGLLTAATAARLGLEITAAAVASEPAQPHTTVASSAVSPNDLGAFHGPYLSRADCETAKAVYASLYPHNQVDDCFW